MAVTRSISNKFRRKRIYTDSKENINLNFTGWYSATSINQAGGSVVEPYLPLFALNLGASNSEIGILAGLFSLLNIMQILWAKLSIKFGNNKFFVLFSQIITYLFFIPLAFLKLGQFLLLLLVRFIQGLFYSANFPSMASLQSDYISDKERASKITKFTYLGFLGSFIGAILGGFLFSLLNSFHNDAQTFSIIFIFTAVIGLLSASIFYFSIPNKVKMPVLKEILDPISLINMDTNLSISKLTFFNRVVNYAKKFKSFWIFTFFGFIFYFAIYMVAPFFIIIEINSFNFSFFEASIFTAISIIPQILILIVVTKYDLMNQFGRKVHLSFGVILINIFAILFFFSYFLPANANHFILFLYFCIIWFILGIGWGLFNSTMAVLLLDIAHPQYRSLLVAIFNACTGLAMFFGPVIGGILIDFTNNLFFPLIPRIFISIFALIYLIVFIKEPVISGLELKPLKNVFPFLTRMSSTRGPDLHISYGNEKIVREKYL